MAVVTDSIFIDILLTLPPIMYLIYRYMTSNDDYWDKRGVPYAGWWEDMFKGLFGLQSPHEEVSKIYDQYPGSKLVGFFQVFKPKLMVRDPDLIHQIMIKDFVHFQDRGGLGPPTKDPLSNNLFGLKGKLWRALRYKLTPTFTTGKLRMMLEQVSKSGDNLLEKLEAFSNEGKSFNSKEVTYEFTLDVICSCAFGLQLNPNSEEFKKFKLAVSQLFYISASIIIRGIILFTSPLLTKLLGITMFPKESTEYFINFTKATVKHRRDNKVERNDYLQLLLKLKEQEDSGKDLVSTLTDVTEDDDVIIDQLRYTEVNGQASTEECAVKLMTEDTICANSFIFLTAGSESTANTITFTLYNLTQHPEVQQRLQDEVDSVLALHGRWTYDAVKDLKYMDQVVQETQRLTPLLAMLERECVIPYKVPGTDLVIEKGVDIAIPVVGLHHDPQYYPEPELFNPDRFEGNNFKPNSTFLPFGDGPRMCIAMRFAVMEVKTCLAKIISRYTVSLSPKTKTPIKMKKRAFFPDVEGGIWLDLKRRNTIQPN